MSLRVRLLLLMLAIYAVGGYAITQWLIRQVRPVGKPTGDIAVLVAQAQDRIVIGAVTGGVILLVVLLLAASWVVAPLERLTDYARAVRDRQPATPPKLPGRTLHELGNAFEQMRDALEGRQHAERYTRALAHEIKAPLAAIRGAAELLEEPLPPRERAQFLGNIRREGDRIQRSIERLLELTSVEARRSLGRPERIDVGGLLCESADAVQGAFDAAGVRLARPASGDGFVHGDRFLLRQALINLLQNALDFSPAGGEVVLATRAETGRVVVSVQDHGPGVPEYALPRVFERFYSLPRPGTKQKSTGIGLALVREIAHLHGGDASLVNTSGGGARAELWLPSA